MFALSAIYTAFIVYVLHSYNLWNFGQLKNTLLWFLTVAVISIVGAIQSKDGSNLIQKLILDNLKLIVILEFIIDFYPLNLLFEIFLVPILVALTMMVAFSENEEKHVVVHKFFNGVLIAFGLALVVRALFKLYGNFGSFANASTLADFSLPPVLSLLYLPFIFILYFYVKYENAFIRIELFVKNEKLSKFTKRYALTHFHIRIKRLESWLKSLVWQEFKNEDDIKNSINDYNQKYDIANNPPTVPLKEGWSPFKAIKFLESHGLIADMYHHTCDEEWYAASDSFNLNKKVFSNHVNYYLHGTESSVTKIKLKLKMNELKFEEEDLDTFNQMMSDVLIQSKLIPLNSVEGTFTLSEGETEEFNYGSVSLKKVEYLDGESYGIDFEITHHANRESA